MKKSTKKIIISVVIILVMGLSSVAYVATGIFGGTQQQGPQELTSPIVKGEVSTEISATYIQRGFTWVKYYSAEPNTDFTFFIESLPQAYPTPSGQPQIIVQEINQSYNNETNYMIITSLAGEESFSADTNKIVSALCNLLTITPFECLVGSISNSTAANSTG